MSNSKPMPAPPTFDQHLLSQLDQLLKPKKVAETSDIKIERKGTKIILPNNPEEMPIKEAIEHLERVAENEEVEVGIHVEVRAFPMDGAVAFMKAMQQMFGWVTPRPTPGFFGPTPPTMVEVPIGLTESVQVIWGAFQLPGVDGKLQTGQMSTPDGEYIFCIRGNVKQKYLKQIKDLAALTQKIVDEESIYKYKAIRLRVSADDGTLSPAAPAFISIERRDPLILPQSLKHHFGPMFLQLWNEVPLVRKLEFL